MRRPEHHEAITQGHRTRYSSVDITWPNTGGMVVGGGGEGGARITKVKSNAV